MCTNTCTGYSSHPFGNSATTESMFDGQLDSMHDEEHRRALLLLERYYPISASYKFA